MTRLWNDPANFADEMTTGFVAANPDRVRRVTGGVVRATVVPERQVAVVIGGGSGHYPAFAGMVGQGLAHGAALGNIFASPSAQQVHSVATAAEQGGGVLLCYGNYAGDVLNFDAAQQRLRAEGIDCETVTVTDDTASASIEERSKRRGVAGDLTVFRSAAAAAESGGDLAEVARVARHANERTRSFGVAFSGCTLPGASEPLFSVAPGRMAMGLGIHGEPGIDERDIPSANELAELLVARLLDEIPEGIESLEGQRVVPIVNGLGSLKYEELFVLYGRIASLLGEAGLDIIDPHVGEFCTSFDMEGVSLTLFWLDDELATLWAWPVDAPAYRRGAVSGAARADVAEPEEQPAAEIPPASAASRRAAGVALKALEATAATINDHVETLGKMDAVAGDGDHGIGMQRGSHAALASATEAVAASAGLGTVLTRAGDAWADRAGGTSGALWGVILRSIGDELGDDAGPTAGSIATGVAAAAEGIVAYGKAKLGDKTMVDALLPFTEELSQRVTAGADLIDAWKAASHAAESAAAATADLLPRMGRARPHAEKSIGTPDPGAYSLALIVTSIGHVLAGSALRKEQQ